ncbi:hypothetical protein HMPREF1261_00429 [Corynebacterium sp. KPL1818]|uniref:hypothetical protein n=1 Tax=Corynebacterium sp. KPL1818 TaxID=1203559 RepID=UPI0003B8BF05|nr:hypothetical protein [Corynebacterium sp. KPL1818]ERS60765.1 hypothetical protein HMPREF1261_00429 [Corynebacterium sp. KPL1818]
MTDPILLPHDQHIIVSALRHCRERRSYFLRHTTRWVMEHWDELHFTAQMQLAQDVHMDLHLREEATQEEKAQLTREQPEWEEYLNFIERKMNE